MIKRWNHNGNSLKANELWDHTIEAGILIDAKVKRYNDFHMKAAYMAGNDLSFAKKRKVGAVLVDYGNIVGYGFNGTPAGEDNNCEDADGNTLPSVIHAEINLLLKVQTFHLSGMRLFVTKEPCINCAREIIKRRGSFSVYYCDQSQSKPGEGLQVLTGAGLDVYRMAHP